MKTKNKIKLSFFIVLFCFYCLFFVQVSTAQSILFSENIGTPTTTTSISIYATGTSPATFQNIATLSYTGTADVRNTSSSSGYIGASGNGNVFITTTNGTFFQISNINTANYNNLNFSFGIFKSTTASNGSDMIVEVSSDGTNFSPLPFTTLSTGTGTATWYLVSTSGTIPSTSNLRVRFRQNGSATQFRIDDIKLTGNLAAATSNDSCSSATTLTLNAAPFLDSAKSFNDTRVPAVSCSSFTNGDANDDLWFKFTTTTAGDYAIKVNPSSGYDAVIEIKDSCNGSPFSCMDNRVAGDSEILVAKNLLASTSYLLRVYDYGSGIPLTKTFTIAVANATTTSNYLVQWDFSGLTGYGTSPFSPSPLPSSIDVGGLRRSSKLTVSGTAAANAWGANGWSASTTLTNSVIDTDSSFITFSVRPKTGYTLTIDSINSYNVRRSSSGPTNGQWQYKINSGNYNNIGSSITWGGTASTGNLKSSINLTSSSAFQNLGSTDTVTFRIVNWGSTASTGTWYLNDLVQSSPTTDPDFFLSGKILLINSVMGSEGDYQSKSSGNWDDYNNWQKFTNGSWKDCSTGDFPNNNQSTINILNGHTITLNTTQKSVKDLKVNGGGKLFCNTQTQRYLNVFGNITCNGTIGNGSTTDGLSFNMEGLKDTISGSGSISCYTLQKSLTKNQQSNVFITTNIQTTNSSTSIYNGSTGRMNMTIDAGDTINCLNGGNICIDGTGLVQTGDASGKITVNGVLIADSLYLQTDNALLKDSCKVQIGSSGVLTANTILSGASGNAKDSLVILSGGRLQISGPLGFQNFSNTNNVFYFESGSNVAYNSSSAQTIATGIPSYPNLILSGSGNKTAGSGKDLIVSGNLQIEAPLVLSDKDLYVSGNWNRTSNGNFNANDRRVVFNGNADANITANGGQYFPYLTLNKTSSTGKLSLSDSISIGKELRISSGTLDLVNKPIVLLSDSVITARLDSLNSQSNIAYSGTGRFEIQRYIATGVGSGKHGKSWQFLATPIQDNASTIRSAWQEGSNTPNDNLNPGYGTQIVSPLSGATSTLGFDAIGNSSSIKTYNATNNSWEAVNSTLIPIFQPKGYMVFVRGDRSVNNVSAFAKPTVLRMRGKLADQNSLPPQVVTVQADKFESVGNPYASSIDFTKLTRTGGLNDLFYVWDPTVLPTGAYQTISATNSYKPLPGSAVYDPNTAVTSIQSGQAFFVRSTGVVGQLGFSEQSKLTGTANVFRFNGNSNSNQSVRISLFPADADSTNYPLDVALLLMNDEFQNGIDQNDAVKIPNNNPSVSLRLGSAFLVINARKQMSESDSAYIQLSNLQQGNYHLAIEPKIQTGELTFSIWDRYTHTQSSLTLNQKNYIHFQVTGDPLSQMPGRFVMLSNKNKVLPLQILSLRFSEKTDDEATCFFSNSQETNMFNYELQKANSSQQFKTIYVWSNLLNNSQSTNYQFKDELGSLNDNIFYRVMATDKEGYKQYSNTICLNKKKVPRFFSVSPNPVTHFNINLNYSGYTPGFYQIKIINIIGQPIWQKMINLQQGDNNMRMELPKHITPGIYEIEIKYPQTQETQHACLMVGSN